MVSLIEQIQADLKAAMKDKQADVLSVLRMLLAAVKNKEIELKSGEELKNDLVMKALKSEVKKRKDSIQAYQQGNRDDLVKKEQAELEILDKYLPEQMSEADIENIVKTVINDLGEASLSDFGKVMGAAMAKTKDQADGQAVQEIVKRLLNS